jgi:hypothetical protein
MKKFVVTVLVVGMAATAADAATLRMNFPGGATEWTLAPSETVEVEIWIDLLAGDNFIGGFYSNEDAPGLLQQSTSAPLPGWAADPFGDGKILGPTTGQQVNVGDATPLVQEITGPGSYLWAIQVIHQEADPPPPVDYDVAFAHDSVNLFFYQNASNPSVNFTYWDPSGSGYAGYYSYGTGSPYVAGTKQHAGQPANPLILHCVPEPGSLALLVLGGLSLLRRRR